MPGAPPLEVGRERVQSEHFLAVAIAQEVETPNELALSISQASDRLQLEPGSCAISQVADDRPHTPGVAQGEQSRWD